MTFEKELEKYRFSNCCDKCSYLDKRELIEIKNKYCLDKQKVKDFVNWLEGNIVCVSCHPESAKKYEQMKKELNIGDEK